eukprot:3704874-Amphidinium_carterae.1
MPAQPKAMPRQSASGAASAHEERDEPDVDQVLEMEAEEDQGNDGDNEEVYHLGMLGGDGELGDEFPTVTGDVGRVDDPDTAPPGGSSPGSLIPDQEVQVLEEHGEQESESSNDSSGTYATPQWTDETPTVEEDLTWEQEDLEEEAREREDALNLQHQLNPLLG